MMEERTPLRVRAKSGNVAVRRRFSTRVAAGENSVAYTRFAFSYI